MLLLWLFVAFVVPSACSAQVTGTFSLDKSVFATGELVNAGSVSACGNNSQPGLQPARDQDTGQSQDITSSMERKPRQLVMANDRLEVVPPNSALYLGIDNKVEIKIHAVGLRRLFSLQSRYDEGKQTEDRSIDEHGTHHLVTQEGGRTFIHIVPRTLGNLCTGMQFS
jgi:hypothetical protein